MKKQFYHKQLHLALGVPFILYAVILLTARMIGISWQYIIHSAMFSYFVVFGIAELILFLFSSIHNKRSIYQIKNDSSMANICFKRNMIAFVKIVIIDSLNEEPKAPKNE